MSKKKKRIEVPFEMIEDAYDFLCKVGGPRYKRKKGKKGRLRIEADGEVLAIIVARFASLQVDDVLKGFSGVRH